MVVGHTFSSTKVAFVCLSVVLEFDRGDLDVLDQSLGDVSV